LSLVNAIARWFMVYFSLWKNVPTYRPPSTLSRRVGLGGIQLREQII